MKVKGTIKPLHDKVFVSDMEFGEQKTASGLFIPSANGRPEGITPRWGKVWAVGPEQTEVKVGDWVVDIHGDYCKVTRIGYKARDNGEDGAVWGFWSDNKSEELYTSPEYISLVFI